MAIQLITTKYKPSLYNFIPVAKNEIKKLEKKLGISIAPFFKGEHKETFQYMEDGKLFTLIGTDDGKDGSKMALSFRSICFKTQGSISIDVAELDDHTASAIIFGACLSAYKNNSQRTDVAKENKDFVKIYIKKDQLFIGKKAVMEADSQMNAMHLVDTPSNIKTPLFLADYAKKSGKKYGFSTTILDEKKLTKLGMHALLSVGQGSTHETCMIIMEYKPAKSKSKSPKLGLVGKGITFDTGGISIKPSLNLGYMKSDMGGGAAVIGAMELITRLGLDIHVVGIVPTAENAVDGSSIRPGDVIGSYSGKTIEVIDTDAEGRLVLADGLSYLIKNYKPENIVDLATLTGSCVATLGSVAAGLFSANESLIKRIHDASEKTSSKVWRLPLWEEYASEMASDIADIKNLSTKPVAGAITAAKFLEFFTEKHPSWAHLDIAGVAFIDSEFSKSRSATGFGVRLMAELASSLSSENSK
jgi:leucyl aminopeptidase